MTSFQEAIRKARFGHKDWMAYRDHVDTHVVERLTPAGIKKALLAGGTKTHFTLIAADSGTCHRYNWRMGIGLLRNWRYLV